MVKQHDIKVSIERYSDMISGNLYIVLENKEYEKGDYILVRKDSKEVEEQMMCMIEFVNHDEGLQEGYVLLKLNKIN